MKKGRILACGLVVVAAIIAVAVGLRQRVRHDGTGQAPAAHEAVAEPAAEVVAAGAAGSAVAEPVKGRAAPTRGDADAALDKALAALRAAGTPEEARNALAALRSFLGSLPAGLAGEAIAGYLADPAKDAATKIEFAVGKGGMLEGHPSLRVALLDWLGEIDPQRAGAVAASILATPTQPDEWAVCLRNYAKANPGEAGRGFLRDKAEEMIRNPQWRAEPSVGFLEAFDVLVHVGATESAGLLGELVADRADGGRALAHAAFLALDRLTIREPVAMLGEFAARPQLAEARPEMVANLFARADLREPAQQQLVRDYLLDPARSAPELAAFAGVFPNNNYAVSNNLLTETRTPRGDELAVHDAAALAIVESWLAEPAFEPVKRYLATMRERLANFVGQAGR